MRSLKKGGSMPTPTNAEVGRASKKPTVVEIDGFRGRLISAGHADYDTARAVWNGAIDRRPRIIGSELITDATSLSRRMCSLAIE